jgi:hypothetical protein
MVSFIIPTIYKSSKLPKLLTDLENHNLVDEILLIEHAPSIGMLDGLFLNKTKIIPFTTRKYSSAGWNYGVKNVSNYYYALCNDDINFDTILINDILNFYKSHPNSGFIGMHPDQYNFENYSHNIVCMFEKKLNAFSRKGWGCLIFNHKDNDVIIPDDLTHWCGDEYYLTYSKFQNYYYLGSKITTNMSESSDDDVLKIVLKDQEIFKKKYQKK